MKEHIAPYFFIVCIFSVPAFVTPSVSISPFNVPSVRSAAIRTFPNVTVHTGGSFSMFLPTTTYDYIMIYCNVLFPNPKNKYLSDRSSELNLEFPKNNTDPRFRPFASRTGGCGFVLSDVTKRDEGNYTIVWCGDSNKGNLAAFVFISTILTVKVWHAHPNITVHQGESFSLVMPVITDAHEIYNCTLSVSTNNNSSHNASEPIDLMKLPKNADPRLHPLASYLEGCGIVLDSVTKADEGNYTILLHEGWVDEYMDHIGYIQLSTILTVEDGVEGGEVVRNPQPCACPSATPST